MATTTTAAYVIDVTDQTFATDVLERSKTVPVVVDFWAAWCGPCRMLGPILERLANEYQGQFILAKIDVDQNPRTAMQFRVQGIPAVKAFRDGRLANEFTGALPEPQVRRFIEGLLPSEADLLVHKARAQETSGKLEQAEETYRAALGQKADHYTAQIGLGRTLLKLGRLDEGISTLENVPPGVAERTTADALIATAQFRRHAAGQSEAELRARVEAGPADVASRYALASMALRAPSSSYLRSRRTNSWKWSAATANMRMTAPARPCWLSLPLSARIKRSPAATAKSWPTSYSNQ